MTEPVKRYDPNYSAISPADDLAVEADDGMFVMHDDYARLEQECERLRADMRFLAEYIAVESTGHPLPNYLAVGRFPIDVARAALSAKP